jgi:hypothetical protein
VPLRWKTIFLDTGLVARIPIIPRVGVSVNGTENLAVLRHIALNLLKRETWAKRRSLKGKRTKAAWDEAYLFKVLASHRTGRHLTCASLLAIMDVYLRV